MELSSYDQKLLRILEENKDILVQKDICTKCRGLCCRRCGCSYLPIDFEELTLPVVLKKLEEGETSIVCSMCIDSIDDNIKNIKLNPLFYLRVRNRKRPVIDLFSPKARCSVLTENGCKYTLEKRPSLAKALIPSAGMLSGPIENQCYSLFDGNDTVLKGAWTYHQTVLRDAIYEITGRNYQEEVIFQLHQLSNFLNKYSFEEICANDELLSLKEMLNVCVSAIRFRGEDVFVDKVKIKSKHK